MTRLASASSILCAGGTASVNIPFANVVTTATFVRLFENPNPFANNSYDYFGQTVETNGTYVVVSAYGEAESAFVDFSGKAYIFSAANGALLYTLRNPIPEASAYFGQPTALQGNNLIVAAASASSYSGRVHRYAIGSLTTPPATITTAALTLYNPNPIGSTNFDYFGKSVAYSGGRIVVGSQESGNVAGDYAGRAYVYDTSGNLLYTLRDPNAYGTANNDAFGDRVAISNTYVAVSATAELDAGATSTSGKVYIFDVTTGSLVYTLNNPNVVGTSNGDAFGTGLSISNDHLVVGATGEDTATTYQYGAVYVYEFSKLPTPTGTPITVSNATYVLKNPNAAPNNNDYYGTALAISNTTIAVGSYRAEGGSTASGGPAGKIFLYDTRNLAVANGVILPTTTVNPPASNSGLGISISISGNSMAVGVWDSPSKAALYTLS